MKWQLFGHIARTPGYDITKNEIVQNLNVLSRRELTKQLANKRKWRTIADGLCTLWKPKYYIEQVQEILRLGQVRVVALLFKSLLEHPQRPDVMPRVNAVSVFTTKHSWPAQGLHIKSATTLHCNPGLPQGILACPNNAVKSNQKSVDKVFCSYTRKGTALITCQLYDNKGLFFTTPYITSLQTFEYNFKYHK